MAEASQLRKYEWMKHDYHTERQVKINAIDVRENVSTEQKSKRKSVQVRKFKRWWFNWGWGRQASEEIFPTAGQVSANIFNQIRQVAIAAISIA